MQRAIRFSVLAILAILTGCSRSTATRGGTLDPNQILSSYRQTLSSVERFALKSSYSLRIEGDVEPNMADMFGVAHNKVSYRRDGEKVDVVGQMIQLDREGNVVEHGYSRDMRAIVTDHVMRYYSLPGGKPPFAVRSPDLVRGRSHARQLLGHGTAVIDGFMPDNLSVNILEVIRNGSSLELRQETELVDGHETHVLDAETEYGHMTLWLDPSYGYLPRRMEIDKDEDDLHGYKKQALSTPPRPLGPKEHARYPRAPLEEYSVSAGSIRIEKIGDSFMVTQAHIVITQEYSTGERVVFTGVLKRSGIDLNPDFAAMRAFVPDLPNGTPVADRAFPGIRHVWQNGHSVIHADAKAAKLRTKQPGARSSGNVANGQRGHGENIGEKAENSDSDEEKKGSGIFEAIEGDAQ